MSRRQTTSRAHTLCGAQCDDGTPYQIGLFPVSRRMCFVRNCAAWNHRHFCRSDFYVRLVLIPLLSVVLFPFVYSLPFIVVKLLLFIFIYLFILFFSYFISIAALLLIFAVFYKLSSFISFILSFCTYIFIYFIFLA